LIQDVCREKRKNRKRRMVFYIKGRVQTTRVVVLRQKLPGFQQGHYYKMELSRFIAWILKGRTLGAKMASLVKSIRRCKKYSEM
jgi:hypothetical protein